MNEIIDHFTTDNIYGKYASLLKIQPIQLVFEDLDFVNLGRSKEQKRQINLIKGVLTLLEEKIKEKLHNLPIEIIYVNPAYTSQTCPNCGFVAKKIETIKQSSFDVNIAVLLQTMTLGIIWLASSFKVFKTMA